MTIEEAINYTEAMKSNIQEGLSRFGKTNIPAVYYSDLAFLSVAQSALREQEERESQKPLSVFLAPMDTYKGLKQKFLVFKSDTGEMVENCFVLRPDKDPAAVAALRAYAEATDNDTLAADIINWVGTEQDEPLTLDELRQMNGEPVWIKAKHYGVYADIVHIIGREEGEQYVSFKINYRLQENGCGKTWNAYRSKPKEDT